METQNGRSIGWLRTTDHCRTWNQTDRYIRWGLEETWQESPKYYSSILGITECVGKRHCKEDMGQISQLVSGKVNSEQVVSSKEVISSEDERWWFGYRTPQCIQHYYQLVFVYIY